MIGISDAHCKMANGIKIFYSHRVYIVIYLVYFISKKMEKGARFTLLF